MKGEYISIETTKIMGAIEKENKELQQENFILKDEIDHLRDFLTDKDKIIDKAIEYIEHRQEDINNGGNEHEYKSNEFIINILKGEKNGNNK